MLVKGVRTVLRAPAFELPRGECGLRQHRREQSVLAKGGWAEARCACKGANRGEEKHALQRREEREREGIILHNALVC